jgi:hypothetical protein
MSTPTAQIRDYLSGPEDRADERYERQVRDNPQPQVERLTKPTDEELSRVFTEALTVALMGKSNINFLAPPDNGATVPLDAAR